MPRRFLPLLMLAGLALGAPALAAEDACVPAGAWVDAASGETVAGADVLAQAARRAVVLLGEAHDNADHHRWQLQTVAALHARAPAMVLGFESFPRRVQPVLDDWVAGGLDEAAFLDAVGWDRVWGMDPALYMPLFHFARINRVPMVALNVERALIERIREVGWAGVEAAGREGVSDPAIPDPAYRDWLSEVYREHLERQAHGGEEEARGGVDAGDPGLEDDPGLGRFIDAQLAWDRAMAEALATAAGRPQRPLVVGMVGSGHLEQRWGVPHQLAALGLPDAAVLLPWDRGRDCADLAAGLADAVFGFDAPRVAHAPEGPRLGVYIRSDDGGLRVIDVAPGSIAEETGVRADDLIVEAAGVALARPADLVAVVRRQAPGTWLPLVLERDGAALDLVARFPVMPGDAPGDAPEDAQ